MPVIAAPPSATHELPGARFTALVGPRLGARDTSVWRVELAADAARGDARGGVRDPCRSSARHARRRAERGRRRRRGAGACRYTLRDRVRGGRTAERAVLSPGWRASQAARRRAVHAALGAV